MTLIEKKLSYSNSLFTKILVIIYILIHSYKYGSSISYQRILWRKFGHPEYWNLTFMIFLVVTAVMLHVLLGSLEFLLHSRNNVQDRINHIHNEIISDLEKEKEQKLHKLPSFGSKLRREEIIKSYELRKEIKDKEKRELEEKISKPFF